VKKIQIHTGIVDLNYPVPYSLSYVLGDPLVIPPSRATQVPLGMVAEEIVFYIKFQASNSLRAVIRNSLVRRSFMRRWMISDR